MNARATDSLPEGPLLSFYGDDFTGSSAVAEVMTFSGLATVLFLDIPTDAQLARFAHCRAIGIAGIARSKGPDWMDRHLPSIYAALARLQAPIAHYKVCSTLDSSPAVGSIGRAIDIGAPILGGAWHPLLVAAPALQRYQVFGNLFAAVDGVSYRLDRHPTMSRHPVTPMTEADVGRHIAAQTNRKIGLVDILSLRSGDGDRALARERDSGAEVVSLDVMDARSLVAAGQLIWEGRGERLFAIGSQGIEYALTAYWREAGLLDPGVPRTQIEPCEHIAVVSGSCSPVTAAQIDWASGNGFGLHRLDASLATDETAWTAEVGRTIDAALRSLGEGRDPLVFTASGPDDPAVASLSRALEASGVGAELVSERIGVGLGNVLEQIVRRASLRRGVIAGGDTSGHGMRTLGIHALTALAPAAPGSPICQTHSEDPVCDGLEIALKGGQVGQRNFFGIVRSGGRVDV